MTGRLSEYRDLAQDMMETTAEHVGKIATIVGTAVVGVAREVNDLVTDGKEIREVMLQARHEGTPAVGSGDVVIDTEAPAVNRPIPDPPSPLRPTVTNLRSVD